MLVVTQKVFLFCLVFASERLQIPLVWMESCRVEKTDLSRIQICITTEHPSGHRRRPPTWESREFLSESVQEYYSSATGFDTYMRVFIQENVFFMPFVATPVFCFRSVVSIFSPPGSLPASCFRFLYCRVARDNLIFHACRNRNGYVLAFFVLTLLLISTHKIRVRFTGNLLHPSRPHLTVSELTCDEH